MEPWEAALDTFLEPWRRRTCVIGALACGSHVTGNPSKHSDIDVQIILADGTTWRERGNCIVDGFLVEYFANPPSQMPEYFRGDYEDNSAMAATQFATGRVLFDKDGVVAGLRREARKWLRKRYAKPGRTWLQLTGYGLWDRLDNLRDAHERQAPDLAYACHDTLNAIYSAYAKLLGAPILHPYQQYRTLSDPDTAKRKYLIEPFPDQQFLDLFLRAMTETDADRMIKCAEDLTSYVHEKMGGFEIDGWKFRSRACLSRSAARSHRTRETGAQGRELASIEIIEAAEEDMPVIGNLIRFYIYDMSEHMGWDCPENGLFGGCDELPQFWGKSCDPEYTWPKGWRGFPYLVRVDGKLAGFSLVRQIGENRYDICQFFILRKFRGKGIGRHVAFRMFDMFRGDWEVAQMPENAPARAFWTRIIAEYAGGDYRESVAPDPLFPDMDLVTQHFRTRG